MYFPSWPEEKISNSEIEYSKEIERKKDNNILRIMFTGNVGQAQSFETMIEAAIILKKI